MLEREAALAARRPELLVVRVDRIDPSKNIVRGLHAFALLLEGHPELHGRVGLVGAPRAVPAGHPRVRGLCGRGGGGGAGGERSLRAGRLDPVELDVADDFPRSVAGYKQFDVLLVNPVFDGLNLVAKEAFLLNERDGVLVLSENAGSYEELGDWALGVNPLDVSGTAEALHAALELAPAERTRRATAIREHVRRHDIHEWIAAQLADLEAVRSGK